MKSLILPFTFLAADCTFEVRSGDCVFQFHDQRGFSQSRSSLGGTLPYGNHPPIHRLQLATFLEVASSVFMDFVVPKLFPAFGWSK